MNPIPSLIQRLGLIAWLVFGRELSAENVRGNSKDSEEQEKQEEGAGADLETLMDRKGYVWANGEWVKRGKPVLPARSERELKDSDRDGFDDFTETKFHTDPLSPESTPASYFQAKGSNRVTFYGTNATAHGK